MRTSRSTRLSTTLNVTLVTCALVTTGLLVRAELRRPNAVGRSVTRLALERFPEADRYLSGGRRTGPTESAVKMLVFSDYECPACKVLNEELELRRRNGTLNFAISYRHWALPTHRFAEEAAVASECAGAQGRFIQMHDALFANQPNLGKIPWEQYAAMAGVPDSSRFSTCLLSKEVLAAVREDARVAQEMKAYGTPTVIVKGGARFAGVPAKAVLDSLVAALSSH